MVRHIFTDYEWGPEEREREKETGKNINDKKRKYLTAKIFRK
jgi:hypothetical protein